MNQMNQILMYQTIKIISNWSVWLSGIITVLLTLRVMQDFFKAYFDDDFGIQEAMRKSKKRIAAVVIALTVTSLVTLFKKYYT